MYMMDKVNSPADLKKLKIGELLQYAKEVRGFLIQSVSKTGGHLASNLGVVELTIALHYVFNTPEDKIIWDVGHQSYVHKIITGRKDKFGTLRQFGGLSGFPKTAESEHDCFNTGHSSTSISVAAGMARARDLRHEDYNVISVIGDGALTGGMAMEALSDAGLSDTRMIVILNDNEMSISENVGGISKHLSNLRSARLYNQFRKKVIDQLSDAPGIKSFVRNLKNSLKYTVVPHTLFEDVGFRYLGPFDGHDLKGLIKLLKRVRNIEDSVVVHVTTKKGKGYLPAEMEPHNYHGVSQFAVETGIIGEGKRDYSAVFGQKLVQLAKQDSSVVAITAAMPAGTGLTRFSRLFPDRFFDVGIAEQHAASMAAGMAKAGMKPVFAVYSSFLQRAYDQVLHDIGLQNLHVVFGVDRAGIVGADGETHQGIYDLSFLGSIPNMTILAPSCFSELENMLEYAVNRAEGPVAVRYPRGVEEGRITYQSKLEMGRGELLEDGNDVLLLAVGDMTANALKVRSLLEKKKIFAAVADLRFVRPLDVALIEECVRGKKLVVTLEDNILSGGVGSEITMLLAKRGVKTPVCSLGFDDRPVPHGSVHELFALYGLTPEAIARRVEREVRLLWEK